MILRVVNEIPRATMQVIHRGRIRINSQRMVKRRKDVLHMDGSIRRLFGIPIGGSNDSARTYTSPKHHGKVCSGPMITTSLRIDSRSPSKFPPDDDRHIMIQTTFMQVIEQGLDTTVKVREMISRIFKIRSVRLSVPIPATIIHRYCSHARFNQSSSSDQVVVV